MPRKFPNISQWNNNNNNKRKWQVEIVGFLQIQTATQIVTNPEQCTFKCTLCTLRLLSLYHWKYLHTKTTITKTRKSQVRKNWAVIIWSVTRGVQLVAVCSHLMSCTHFNPEQTTSIRQFVFKSFLYFLFSWGHSLTGRCLTNTITQSIGFHTLEPTNTRTHTHIHTQSLCHNHNSTLVPCSACVDPQSNDVADYSFNEWWVVCWSVLLALYDHCT